MCVKWCVEFVLELAGLVTCVCSCEPGFHYNEAKDGYAGHDATAADEDGDAANENDNTDAGGADDGDADDDGVAAHDDDPTLMMQRSLGGLQGAS